MGQEAKACRKAVIVKQAGCLRPVWSRTSVVIHDGSRDDRGRPEGFRFLILLSEGAPQAQCAHSATISASGRTRDPYFEILGAPRGIMVTPSGGFEF